MGMVAILVKWPGPFEQNFIPLSQVGATWNLTLIGPVVSEEEMFKILTTTNDLDLSIFMYSFSLQYIPI